MILFGHRGAAAELPENTLAGFRRAIEAGVNGVELDVRLSKDGRLVVVHDETVDRTMEATGPVRSFTAAELSALRSRGEGECGGVPLLAEALEVIRGVPHLQIEIKSDSPERLQAVAALLDRELEGRAGRDRVVVTSFDPEALRRMKVVAPRQRLALIGWQADERFLARALELGCGGICLYHPAGSRQEVDRAHELDLEVTGWPGNTEEELATLIAWEVDSITSDCPSLAVPILRERGLLP